MRAGPVPTHPPQPKGILVKIGLGFVALTSRPDDVVIGYKG
jgi:hypothetical protein